MSLRCLLTILDLSLDPDPTQIQYKQMLHLVSLLCWVPYCIVFSYCVRFLIVLGFLVVLGFQPTCIILYIMPSGVNGSGLTCIRPIPNPIGSGIGDK